VAKLSKPSCGKQSAPTYSQGDFLRVELFSGTAAVALSLWIRVQHCDDKRAIVYGIIDDEPSQFLGNALRCGSKLAVSYRQIRECRAPL